VPPWCPMTDERWEFPPRSSSVVLARRHVAKTMRDWGLQDLAEAAALLTSELVTNAVLHARTRIVVAASRTGSKIRIGVTDGSPVPPMLRRRTPTATTGRGMRLLTTLADEWSAEPDGGG